MAGSLFCLAEKRDDCFRILRPRVSADSGRLVCMRLKAESESESESESEAGLVPRRCTRVLIT